MAVAVERADNFSFSLFPNENFLDLRLYQYGWEQCEPLHSFGPFVRNHYLFHYVIAGKGVLHSTDGRGVTRSYHPGPGEGFLICPGQVNTYAADQADPWRYVWLEFDGLRAAEYLESAGLGLSQPLYRPDTPAGGEAVRDEMLYIAGHPDLAPLHLIGHLCLFVDGLVESSSTRKKAMAGQLQDFYMQEAVAYMEHNYQRELTVAEIADACRLNRSYFSKLFRENMGCPPQEFLIRLRLSKAAELMRTTTGTIGEIAQRCGYPDPLHFSHAFKKRYGMPPRQWRRQYRGAALPGGPEGPEQL